MNSIHCLVRRPNGLQEGAPERGLPRLPRACRTLLRSALRPALLATSIAAAILPAGAAEIHSPILVAAGESRTLTGDDLIVYDGGAYAVNVSGAGAMLTGNQINVQVDGRNAGSAIVAAAGADVRLDGGKISMSAAENGTAGFALNAKGNNSVIHANDLTIEGVRNALGEGTVTATAGGKVWLAGGQLSSTGTVLLASGAGSQVHVDGTRLAVGAKGSSGATAGGLLELRALQMGFAPGTVSGRLYANGQGAVLSLTDVHVDGAWLDITDGGVLKISGSDATSTFGSVRLLGNTKKGLTATADIQNSSFTTNGRYGVDINNKAKLTARDAHFTVVDGFSGMWLASGDSEATLINSTVTTKGGSGSHGIDVWGGTATLSGSRVDTYGSAAYGLRASGSTSATPYSRIRASNLDVTAHGDGGGGVFLGGSTADATFEGGSITTLGAASFGVVQMNTAKLVANQLDIHAKGAGSGAYRSYLTVQGDYRNSVAFSDGTLQTEDGNVFWLQGDSQAVALSNIDATGRLAGNLAGGGLLRVSDTVFTNGSSIAAADMRLDADHSRLTGDVLVDSATANLRMALTNGSVLTGALRADTGYQVAALSLDASSHWNLRGTSGVGSLQHAGEVAFVVPKHGDFKTLTISGDYVGDGGRWVLNRQLGGDDSIGDQVVIQGSSSGTAQLTVNNADGVGAATVEGIRLISVAGRSDAQFNLQGRTVAGAYDYFLYKGGLSTPDDGNWYLRSEYVPPVEPVEPTDPVEPLDPTEPQDPALPVDPVSPVEPVAPIDPILPVEPPTRPNVERPEPAAYMANQMAATRMFQHSLHDRASDPGSRIASNDATGAQVWAYASSHQLDSHVAGAQVGVDSHVDSVLVGAGREFDTHAGGQLQIGLMGGRGRASSEAASRVTGFTTHGEVTGSSVGVYATWFQDSSLHDGVSGAGLINASRLDGLYVDSWVQYGRFRNRVQGQGLATEHYRARNWSGSLEGGYALPLLRDEERALYLEPQLQVIHNSYNADNVIEANGTRVESRRAGGTTTRVGVRLYTRATNLQPGQVHPFAAVNWWSGGNGSSVTVDGNALHRELPDDIYEARVGVQVKLSRGWRGWGQLGQQVGSQGYRDTNAQLGMSFSW